MALPRQNYGAFTSLSSGGDMLHSFRATKMRRAESDVNSGAPDPCRLDNDSSPLQVCGGESIREQLAEPADAWLLEEFRIVYLPAELVGYRHQHFDDLHRAAAGVEEVVLQPDVRAIQM